ncbi:MAG: DNA/RNA nuclease SfsA [Cellvibrionaceae bacterium]|nr:DNA/RNA nuclease SfsA [Cellvibrionaceae bacterium]
MRYEKPLQGAVLIKRYKRFLADVVLPSGEQITVHCPNTGAMTNCIVPNSPCWILESGNAKRKYRFGWELATTPCGFLAGINTLRANALTVEAIDNGTVKELEGYTELSTEQRYGSENSRVDIVLQGRGAPCYVEVKSVTLSDGEGCGYFPDAVSVRACKHLRELMTVREEGARAVLFFCVQHTGIRSVSPARHIDPKYAALLAEAMHRGVEVIAYATQICVDRGEVALINPLPVRV